MRLPSFFKFISTENLEFVMWCSKSNINQVAEKTTWHKTKVWVLLNSYGSCPSNCVSIHLLLVVILNTVSQHISHCHVWVLIAKSVWKFNFQPPIVFSSFSTTYLNLTREPDKLNLWAFKVISSLHFKFLTWEFDMLIMLFSKTK